MKPAAILEEHDNENIQSDLRLPPSAVRQSVHHVEPARQTSGVIVEVRFHILTVIHPGEHEPDIDTCGSSGYGHGE